jgi:hypothetical protein
MVKSGKQLERDIAGSTVDSFDIDRGNYRVVVTIDPQRGGFLARLVSVGIGTLMSDDGPTPQAAVARLAKSMREGALDPKDRALAKELMQRLVIYQHSWGARRPGGAR